MPIRSIPLDQVTEADIVALKDRGVREDQTLDYKQELDVRSDKGKFELLKDVSALANTAGGVIVYGVTEGEGDDAGSIVDLSGLALEIDKTQNTIDQLLHDGIDERIPGVRHRALQRKDGRHYLVLRVPPSHLAPHMVRFNFPNVRFYQRGTTTNQPMNARQIKETALRAATAVDRARATISERIQVSQQRAAQRKAIQTLVSKKEGSDQALLHVVPIFGPIDSLDFSPGPLVERLKTVPVFSHRDRRYADERFALEGLYREGKVADEVVAYNLFLRNGAIEFQSYDINEKEQNSGSLWFRARTLEDDIIETIVDVQQLTEEGVVQLPALVSLTLLGTQGSVLHPGWPQRDFVARPAITTDIVAIEPILITDWDIKSIRRLFDMMWQAWGWPSSGSYDKDGRRKKTD